MPTSSPHNPPPNLRIHNLEPPLPAILLPLRDLAIAQLDEACRGRVVAEEAEEGLGGRGVGFAFALDDLVEFAFVEDFVEEEGHGGVWVVLGWGRG